jgi:hypothetical protein
MSDAKKDVATRPETSLEQMRAVAKSVAASKLFGCKTEDEALALMMLAQAEGMHYATAVRDYHIVQGRPALKADAMLARFQAAGGKVDWTEYTDTKVCGVFSHPQAGSITIDWSIERAKQAGLLGKQGPWQQYPRAMMRARCISEGVRTCFPGVAIGVYTPEEIHDMKPATTVEPKAEAPQPLSEAVVEGYLNSMDDCKTLEELQTLFGEAWKSAKNDAGARDTLKRGYDQFKQVLRDADTPASNVDQKLGF